jgi:hypothetical protein
MNCLGLASKSSMTLAMAERVNQKHLQLDHGDAEAILLAITTLGVCVWMNCELTRSDLVIAKFHRLGRKTGNWGSRSRLSARRKGSSRLGKRRTLRHLVGQS